MWTSISRFQERAALLLALVVLLLGALGVHSRHAAAQVSSCGVAIDQFALWPHPAAAGEDVKLAVRGVWYDGCVPQFEKLERNGSGVDLYVSDDRPPDTACGGAEGPWSVEAEAGSFPAGTFTARLFITNMGSGPAEPVLCAERPFYVFDTVYRSYLTAVSKP